jgi:hypothetical protein
MRFTRPNQQAQAVLDERARAGRRSLRDAPVAESRAAEWDWIQYMGEPEPVAHSGTIHGFFWMATAVDERRQMLDDLAIDLRSTWGQLSGADLAGTDSSYVDERQRDGHRSDWSGRL